jgi:2-succinyl-5-enolpyruvyl-6-hydroxy-3-cyclohexene-1-carboxylate synthase
MSQSHACAEAVIATLLAEGVTELVLCPGSRSAPLALAAHQAALEARLRLHVRIDERTAGFLALGLAKGSGRCVPIVTTSGTAVGNLLPAVMEASHARVPLLVISADRPAELVGTGANQTTWQPGIFGVFPRAEAALDAEGAADWAIAVTALLKAARGADTGHPGPAHLNIALPEPLVRHDGWATGTVPAARSAHPTTTTSWAAGTVPVAQGWAAGTVPVAQLAPGPRTVVVCGDATLAEGAAARTFAEAANLPLIAEPSSGARFGPNALRCGRLLLGTGLADRVERVVMFGHPTLSRPVNRLLTRGDIDLTVVGQGPALPNPGHRASRFAAEVRMPPAPAGWLAGWLDADRAAGARLDALLAGLGYPSGPAVAATVLASGSGTLVLGNSMAIRDADLAPITDRPMFANRGLSGIDGTLSTAIGVALATGDPTTLLLGDLSFVHDANALAIGPGQPRPDLRIVVADDAGGAIFATLEYGQPQFADSFETVFATPSGVDPAALARGYGVPTTRVDGLEELAEALAVPMEGLQVVVVGVDRLRRGELAAALAACVR